MYYPIQIPYILSNSFSETIRYKEEIIPHFQNFVICLWETQALAVQESSVEDIILADGCIDLVSDFQKNIIGFTGMSKTVFNFKNDPPSFFYGARFKPGAFYNLTNIPATEVMDKFLPINEVKKDFNAKSFFELPFNEAKKIFADYIASLIQNKEVNEFTKLFDKLNDVIPTNVSEIYEIMNYSPKQCQRLFYKHFGFSPQMALCIIRFQKCLKTLLSDNKSPNEVLGMANYYDQSHFIKDFKKFIGLTPFELVLKYKN
jgi:AraC-like DNA-binding protein